VIIAGNVKTLFTTLSPTGRAPGLWLTLLTEPARRMPGSSASSAYNLNNLKITRGHACKTRFRHLLESAERWCKLTNLPRSTYYHQSKNPSVNDSELIARIEAIIEEFPGYGYRRVTYELNRRGIPVNHKKVLRIMRQRGLLRKTKRHWIKTTDSNHNQRIYPNLTENLVVTAPNQVWAADITYIGI